MYLNITLDIKKDTVFNKFIRTVRKFASFRIVQLLMVKLQYNYSSLGGVRIEIQKYRRVNG